ncbi:MAG: hypothetical protein ACRYG5_13135 [Janthinobacterium lividum]
MTQRQWEDLQVGDELAPVAFPLSTYRMVMAAGANRDFNSIHHNPAFAKASGAPDMYANTYFLQGMWERCIRQFIGHAGAIRSIHGFAMRRFNTPEDTVLISGRVTRVWEEDAQGFAELEISSSTAAGITVGPGQVVVTLPRRQAAKAFAAAPAQLSHS